MKNLDGAKVANTALNAFVSAACGMLGNYVMHRILMATDKAVDKNCAKKNKNKIGFDLSGNTEVK